MIQIGSTKSRSIVFFLFFWGGFSIITQSCLHAQPFNNERYLYHFLFPGRVASVARFIREIVLITRISAMGF